MDSLSRDNGAGNAAGTSFRGVGLNDSSALAGHAAAQIRIAPQFLHGRCELSGIPRRNDSAVSMHKVSRATSYSAADHGQSTGQGFVHDQAPRITVSWKYQAICQAVIGDEVVAVNESGKMH